MSSPQPAVGPWSFPSRSPAPSIRRAPRARTGVPPRPSSICSLPLPLAVASALAAYVRPVGDAAPWFAAVSAAVVVLGAWRVVLALLEARSSPASSPGKALLGLAVVDLDGGRPAAGAAVVRLLLLDLLIAGPPGAAWWLAALRGVDEPLAIFDLQVSRPVLVALFWAALVLPLAVWRLSLGGGQWPHDSAARLVVVEPFVVDAAAARPPRPVRVEPVVRRPLQIDLPVPDPSLEAADAYRARGRSPSPPQAAPAARAGVAPVSLWPAGAPESD